MDKIKITRLDLIRMQQEHDKKNSDCTGKKKFFDKNSADRYSQNDDIGGIKERFKKSFRSYKCPHCGFFHLATEKKKKK